MGKSRNRMAGKKPRPQERIMNRLRKERRPKNAAKLLQARRPEVAGRLLCRLQKPRKTARVLHAMRIPHAVASLQVMREMQPQRTNRVMNIMRRLRPKRAAKIFKQLHGSAEEHFEESSE